MTAEDGQGGGTRSSSNMQWETVPQTSVLYESVVYIGVK